MNDVAEAEQGLEHAANAPVAPQGSLIEGLMVHFYLTKGRCKGQRRAAVVVRVWDKAKGIVNLRVLNDGLNDGNEYASGTSWETSVKYSAKHEPGTWDFLERAV